VEKNLEGIRGVWARVIPICDWRMTPGPMCARPLSVGVVTSLLTDGEGEQWVMFTRKAGMMNTFTLTALLTNTNAVIVEVFIDRERHEEITLEPGQSQVRLVTGWGERFITLSYRSEPSEDVVVVGSD